MPLRRSWTPWPRAPACRASAAHRAHAFAQSRARAGAGAAHRPPRRRRRGAPRAARPPTAISRHASGGGAPRHGSEGSGRGGKGRGPRHAARRRCGDPPRADSPQSLRALLGADAAARGGGGRRLRREVLRGAGLRPLDADEPGHPVRQSAGAPGRPPHPARPASRRRATASGCRRGARALARGAQRSLSLVVRDLPGEATHCSLGPSGLRGFLRHRVGSPRPVPPAGLAR